MAHTCHASGCAAVVPPERFMCRAHWFQLPMSLRTIIWKTYRVGQCKDWRISKAYAEAAKNCIRFLAKKENRELPDDSPELVLYDRLSE